MLLAVVRQRREWLLQGPWALSKLVCALKDPRLTPFLTTPPSLIICKGLGFVGWTPTWLEWSESGGHERVSKTEGYGNNGRWVGSVKCLDFTLSATGTARRLKVGPVSRQRGQRTWARDFQVDYVLVVIV